LPYEVKFGGRIEKSAWVETVEIDHSCETSNENCNHRHKLIFETSSAKCLIRKKILLIEKVLNFDFEFLFKLKR
jgi:hypothetical protein